MKKLITLLLFFVSLNCYSNTFLYVPYAAGGPVDFLGRAIVKGSNNIVTLNKPGGSGQIAIEEMNNRTGLLIMTNFNFFVTNPMIFKNKLRYDPRDYELLALVGEMPGVLICNKSTNIKNIADLQSYSRSLNFGTSIRGGAEHLNTEVLLTKLKVKHKIIVYNQGGTKHYADLLGGHIDCIFGNLPSISVISNDIINKIISTHDLSEKNINVASWKSAFKEDFPLQNNQALLISKKIPIELRNNILNELKTRMDSEAFKDEISRRGFLSTILYDKRAIEVNDRYNTSIMEFLTKNNINLIDE